MTESLAKIIADIRTWHGGFSEDICTRLERIDAEQRDYKRAWEESDKTVTSLLNVQRNLSSDNQELRERLAVAEKDGVRLDYLQTQMREVVDNDPRNGLPVLLAHAWSVQAPTHDVRDCIDMNMPAVIAGTLTP